MEMSIPEQNSQEAAEDRRKHDRFSKNFTIRYTRLEDLLNEDPYQQGELLDISGGGLCFRAATPAVLSSQLVLVLEFPGWQAAGGKWIATKEETDVGLLQVIGMVVWVAASREAEGSFDIGVRFSGMVTG